MAKVPFRRRVSDFFTQGHWDVGFTKTPWTVTVGFGLVIDSAPGYHFDEVGFYIDLGLWTLHVFWVDNN